MFLINIVELLNIIQPTAALEVLRLAESMGLSPTVMLDIIQHAGTKSGPALALRDIVW